MIQLVLGSLLAHVATVAGKSQQQESATPHWQAAAALRELFDAEWEAPAQAPDLAPARPTKRLEN